MNLQQLTELAKQDKTAAEAGVLSFVQEQFPDLQVQAVQINPSAVSLNSVNGFLKTAQQDYFFKFHAEENEQLTVDEYYNTQALVEVGLPVLQALYQSTLPGSQFLIYKKIIAPTGFELFDQPKFFFPAEQKLLQQVQQVYLQTLELTPAEQVASAPIFQLFYHRLVGEQPRLDQFYTANPFFQSLANKTWMINGRAYDITLNQIITAAKEILNPKHYPEQPTVIGHGDDHNGNKFYINGEFKFFDPAFAGRQPALLSFVKATAHNTFLYPDWLYTPEKLSANGLELTWSDNADQITINHNCVMPADRQRELQLQETLVWKPLIAELRQRNWLPEDWQEYLRAALFCCPFLVYNLLDSKRYTPETSILALSKCIELYHYDCNY